MCIPSVEKPFFHSSSLRINKKLAEKQAMTLPKELMIKIFSFLPLKDQAVHSSICKCAKQITDRSLIMRAVNYGYPKQISITFGSGKDYLAGLLGTITTLKKEHFFKKEEMHIKRKFSFFVRKLVKLDREHILLKICLFELTRIHWLLSRSTILKIKNIEFLYFFLLSNEVILSDVTKRKTQWIIVNQLFPRALQKSDYFLLELMLAKNIGPQFKDSYNNTPLHLAVSMEDRKATQLLLKYKADPNVKNKEEHTPLTINLENFKVTKLLLKSHADVNCQTVFNNTALHFSLLSKNPHILTLLLSFKADPHITNDFGDTPLHFAAAVSNRIAIKGLLNSKADPHTTNKAGMTALSINTENSYVAWLLLKNGANPNYQNPYDGNTALHYAYFWNHRKTVKILLAMGANPEIRNYENKRAADFAYLKS